MGERRIYSGRHGALLVPGLAVALFAVASIILPVGRDGLGRDAHAPLSVWARDIHDGFWLTHSYGVLPARAARVATGDRAKAQSLCRLGEGDQAMTIYRRIGVATVDDCDAIDRVNALLVIDADWDQAERTAIASDELLGGGLYRNNLAWHYTQADVRAPEALDLALGSVAEGRDACNVDTLAWAYYRDGQLAVARKVANEVLSAPVYAADSYDGRAQESSRRLLKLLDGGKDSLDVNGASDHLRYR